MVGGLLWELSQRFLYRERYHYKNSYKTFWKTRKKMPLKKSTPMKLKSISEKLNNIGFVTNHFLKWKRINDEVRDPCHITGKNIEVALISYNLKLKQQLFFLYTSRLTSYDYLWFTISYQITYTPKRSYGKFQSLCKNWWKIFIH